MKNSIQTIKKLLKIEKSTPSKDDIGDVYWRISNGKLHRKFGPAIEWANGTKEWHLNGKLHRAVGPAIELADGTKEWWIKGKRHRTDGPAVERFGGHKQWWIDGKLHREDDPAVICANGYILYYINGKELNKEEFNNYKKTNKKDDII